MIEENIDTVETWSNKSTTFPFPSLEEILQTPY